MRCVALRLRAGNEHGHIPRGASLGALRAAQSSCTGEPARSSAGDRRRDENGIDFSILQPAYLFGRFSVGEQHAVRCGRGGASRF